VSFGNWTGVGERERERDREKHCILQAFGRICGVLTRHPGQRASEAIPITICVSLLFIFCSHFLALLVEH